MHTVALSKHVHNEFCSWNEHVLSMHVMLQQGVLIHTLFSDARVARKLLTEHLQVVSCWGLPLEGVVDLLYAEM